MREEGAAAAGGRNEVVELVDAIGRHAGTMPRPAAHDFPGHLHGAFSVFLFDEHGRMLVQRRSMAREHSRGVWSNSCHGHQRPGEPPVRGAQRRVTEELGVASHGLRKVGKAIYQFRDAVTGLAEYEYHHVCVGRVLEAPRPNPAEVVQIKFAGPAELRRMLAREEFSMWFPAVAEVALSRRAATIMRLEGWDPDHILGGMEIPT
jgi:isopentenyl-diphosphate delta-isomerase